MVEDKIPILLKTLINHHFFLKLEITQNNIKEKESLHYASGIYEVHKTDQSTTIHQQNASNSIQDSLTQVTLSASHFLLISIPPKVGKSEEDAAGSCSSA